MELSKIDQYRMRRSQNLPNLKDIIGERVKPIAELEHEYQDAQGELHTVLTIMLSDKRCFRTEVRAFIENYHDFVESFGEDERPDIMITGKDSKRGNKYINFEVVE